MKVWELMLPFGKVAWRMNLLNAVLGACCVGLVANLLLGIAERFRLSVSVAFYAALSMALCFAFSKTFWGQSVSASPYILHMLFVILWCQFAGQIEKTPSSTLPKLYMLVGLALSNHILSLVLLVATIVFSLASVSTRKVQFLAAIGHSILLVPGLLVYLYIPFRAAAAPIVNWGNPSSFPALLNYIARSDYQSKAWAESVSDLLRVISFQSTALLSEFSWVFPVLLVCGLVAVFLLRDDEPLVKEERNLWLLIGLLLVLLNVSIVALHGSYADLFYWQRYFLTAYFGVFLCCCSGAFCLLRYLEVGQRRDGIVCGLALLMICAVAPLGTHLWTNDKSQNTLLERYIDRVLEHVPEGSTLFAQGDNHLFGLMYFHLVEKKRTDLNLVNAKVGLGDNERATQDVKRGMYYSTHFINVPDPFKVERHGLVYRVVSPDEDVRPTAIEWSELKLPSNEEYLAPLEEGVIATYLLRRAQYSHEQKDHNGASSFVYQMKEFASQFVPALLAAGYGFRDIEQIDRAREYFERAQVLNPKDRRAAKALAALEAAQS
jgi:hypothetical protein